MVRIINEGFELNTIFEKTKKKKPFKHKKECNGKQITESTKHFVFIASCSCQLKYIVQDKEDDIN